MRRAEVGAQRDEVCLNQSVRAEPTDEECREQDPKRGRPRRKSESTERMRDRGLLSWPSSRTRDNTSCTLNDQCFLLGSVLVWSSSGCSHLRNKWPDGPEKKPQGGSLALSRNEGRQEPALRSGREAPSSFGRRQRRAVRRTRRSVSIASPQAGRGGPSATGLKLSACGACAALRRGSPEWRRRARRSWPYFVGGDCVALGATHLEPGPKGTRQKSLPDLRVRRRRIVRT